MDTTLPRRGLLAVLAAVLPPGAAYGELLSFDVTLESKTQEFIAGEPVSFDQSFEDFLLTTADLPVQVASRLVVPTVDDSLVAAGQGFADYFEPVMSVNVNPEEFGLEASCFSIVPDYAHEVTARAVEDRTIQFTRQELDSEAGEERDIESSVYLSGAIIVWSQDPARDLTGLTARMTFTVDQFRGADGSETDGDGLNLFRAVVGVEGSAGGAVAPNIAGEGDADVQYVFGGPETVLQRVTGSELLEEYFDLMGQVYVLLIPNQAIDYQYQAEAGEEFELVAEFIVEAKALPDGTGVSAVFGRGFEALAEQIAEAFADVDAQEVESAVNRAQIEAGQSLTLPANDGDTTAADNGTALCGATGFGTLGLLALAMLPLMRRR